MHEEESAGSTATAGTTAPRPALSLVLFGVGIATMWLPIHYSFYRYSIAGGDVSYVVMLVVLLACCIAGVVLRARLGAWLSSRPVTVVVGSVLTLATNGLLLCLPYLPLAAGVSAALRVVAIALYAAMFVLLFFAWVQRMADVMFQLPIATVVGAVGFSVVGVFLLVDLFYGTPVYQGAAVVCLAVSGACWQACRFDAVEASEPLRFLPGGSTLREWSLLLVAFLLVTLLHAITFSSGGAASELSDFPSRLLHTGLVLFCVPFAALLLAARRGGVSPQRSLTLVVSLVVASYLGILCAMSAPGVMTQMGHLAALTVIERTLRIFVFIVLMMMCYLDSASTASVFGLLFLLVEVLSNILCYVVVPWYFDVSPADPAGLFEPASSAISLVLVVVLGGFLAMHYTGRGGLAATFPHVWSEGSGVEASVAETPSAPVSPEEARRARCRELAQAHQLTERETDILYYLSMGYSVKKVAELLVISANTVATHSSRLYRKMDVHSRQELMDKVAPPAEEPASR